MKNTTMKHIYLALATLLLACMPVHAQLSSTTSTLTHDSTFAEGRDFWFAMQSNYWGVDLGGKYLRIYITAAENCTAYVTSNGTKTPIPVTAHEISAFKIPEFWEMESSGKAEDKAIHVWSNTANLIVYDMSHNDYTSDGSYIIPTIGWGTDYVVAAYGSLFDGTYDLPSTCMVVANQDNTTFSIIPSCNVRRCTGGNDMGDSNSAIIVYAKDSSYTFTLNLGQCMQFMPIKADTDIGFDMTGTIIHSNKPVGVEGGSQCPEIPHEFSTSDHVEDMMLSCSHLWGETYYATEYRSARSEFARSWFRKLSLYCIQSGTNY